MKINRIKLMYNTFVPPRLPSTLYPTIPIIE